MKTTLFSFLILSIGIFSANELTAQNLVWSEDFETDGSGGTRYTQTVTCNDGGNDRFGRVTNAMVGGHTYANPNNTWFFSAEDVDASECGGAGTTPEYFISNPINISGLSGLVLNILIAEHKNPGSGAGVHWDDPDYVHVEYSIDGSSFTPLLAFEGQGGTNTEPLEDTNFDGVGDGAPIPASFTNYARSISGTGSIITIRVEVNLNSTDEDIAFDNLRLTTTSTLPVILTNFMGVSEEESILLAWETAEEINSSHFEVEKSLDSELWHTTGQVSAQGMSQSVQNYQFVDPSPYQGVNYYRLKQVDLDGTTVYSNSIAVLHEQTTGIRLFPNPGTALFLEHTDPEASIQKVEILELSGKILATFLNADKGANLELEVGSLVPGMYLIRVQDRKQSFTFRWIKQ